MTDMTLNFKGPWFDSATAAAYVGCKSIKGWYSWRDRRGIVAHGRLVSKADIDHALRQATRRPHRMAPASLANLQKRTA